MRSELLAALSSAGTSGTFDGNDALLVGSRGDQAREAFQAQLNQRGDSLSGKGEATPDKPPVSDNPSGMYCPDCRSVGMLHCSDPEHCGGMKPMSAPDRAEELARKIDAIWQLQLGDDYWPSDARNEAVASLLREAMGRCPTCGLTIVPRLCANPACASSVRR